MLYPRNYKFKSRKLNIQTSFIDYLFKIMSINYMPKLALVAAYPNVKRNIHGTLSKETIYNNQKQKTNNKKNKQTLGKGKI